VHLYSDAKKVQVGTQNPSELASIITTQSTSKIKPHSTANMLSPIARFHGGKKFNCHRKQCMRYSLVKHIAIG
jgi:hypothetical protein